MEFASKVKKGSIFEHRDRNGNIWRATVTRRTAQYVYITIENPYDSTVENYGARAQIRQKYKDVLQKVVDFWGNTIFRTKSKPIDDYYIIIHWYSPRDKVFNLVEEVEE